LEDGESDRDGLKRGIQEETGLDVEVLEFICQHITPKGTEVSWYRCRARTLDIREGGRLGFRKYLILLEMVIFSVIIFI